MNDRLTLLDESAMSGTSHGGVEDVAETLQEQQQQEEDRQRQTLARNESRAVFWLRIAVLGLLFCTAALVSSGVYWYATSDEQDEFEQAFAIHAQKILENLKDAFDQKAGAVGALACTITNTHIMERRYGNLGFPFMTIPNFEVLANNVRVQADALAVVYAPLVSDEQRLEWEEYALENRGQVDVAFDQDTSYRQEEDVLYGLGEYKDNDINNRERMLQQHPNILSDGTQYHPRIWDITAAHNASKPGTGPYIATWQFSPINPSKQLLLNMNWATSKGLLGIFPHILKDAKVIINKAEVPVALGRQQIKATVSVGQYRHQDGNEYLDDPTSFLLYPIFDSFNATNRTLSAYLVVQLYWRLFFTNVLPQTAKGIIVVIESSYNQTLSYGVDGEEATFLGEGVPGVDTWPHFNEAYEHMVISGDLTAEVNQQARPENRAFRTEPLDDTIGVHKVYIYPSSDTEQEHKTSNPMVYTILVASIFCLTAASFLLFNWIVERRQKIVLTRAVQAGTVVASLFPEQVHERLYDNKDRAAAAPEHQEIASSVLPETALSMENRGDKPIADFYPETTILFADLAGFTKWSSSRSPSDVFELLETLYGAFDKAAIRRNVFKVETIGDCYLAVCGLPTPNPDHSVIMAKFANECMYKMDRIVQRMSNHLGPDTADLRLRAGLHSGATVAGVLRGQKSRFQLFGDTVNTAARMESTGTPGKIQVSQATADQLTAKGRENWLHRRDEVVTAKGKGEMKTWWVVIPRHTSSVGTTRSTLEENLGGGAMSRQGSFCSSGWLGLEEDVSDEEDNNSAAEDKA